MSINSIQRAKQLVDTLFYKEAEYFLAQTDSLEQIIDWLCDEDSKKQYQKEISRLCLSHLLGLAPAANLSGNMTMTKWETLCHSIDFSLYPHLEMYQPYGFEKKYYYTSLFILEEYRYKEIFLPEKNDICIDGGAFCGETAYWFVQYGAKQVYAFEPDEKHMEYIEKNILLHNLKAHVFPSLKGLSDSCGQATFLHDGHAARIAPQGTSDIQLTTIDYFCQQNNIVPTLIKLDIEGAEMAALRGAQHIIATHKPKLAICLYHKKEDMVEIPFFLKLLVPEYKFYCQGLHPYGDFILYAMAEKE